MQLAAIFEFTGAMVLGRVSVSTIAGGIANLSDFQREPEVRKGVLQRSEGQ